MDLWSINQYLDTATLEQLREWRKIVINQIYDGLLTDERSPMVLKLIDCQIENRELRARVSAVPASIEFLGVEVTLHHPAWQGVH